MRVGRYRCHTGATLKRHVLASEALGGRSGHAARRRARGTQPACQMPRSGQEFGRKPHHSVSTLVPDLIVPRTRSTLSNNTEDFFGKGKAGSFGRRVLTMSRAHFRVELSRPCGCNDRGAARLDDTRRPAPVRVASIRQRGNWCPWVWHSHDVSVCV